MNARPYAVAGLLTAATVLFSTPMASGDAGSEYVRTQSGKVRCLVTATGQGTGANGPVVICEASGPMSAPFDQWENDGFTQAPMTSYGSHYHNAVVDAAGNFSFQDGGNIGGAYPEDDTVLNYGQPYNIQDWTIQPAPDGTRFTNDATGHGMFVSIDNVYSF